MVSFTEMWAQQDNPTNLRPQLQHVTASTFTMQLTNKKISFQHYYKSFVYHILKLIQSYTDVNHITWSCSILTKRTKHIFLFTSLLSTMLAVCMSCPPIINRDRAVCSHIPQFLTETELQYTQSYYLHYCKTVFSNKLLKKRKWYIIYRNTRTCYF